MINRDNSHRAEIMDQVSRRMAIGFMALFANVSFLYVSRTVADEFEGDLNE